MDWKEDESDANGLDGEEVRPIGVTEAPQVGSQKTLPPQQRLIQL